MPRKKRTFAQSGIYHVTMRGSGRQIIFTDDSDRKKLLELLEEKLISQGIQVLAWCLMDNHVHLIFEDPKNVLSTAMHAFTTAYARLFNMKTGHVGSVFQGRFYSDPIESEGYFLAAIRYVHDNPQAAGIEQTDRYRWSSYSAYLFGHPCLSPERLLHAIGGKEHFEAFSRESSHPKTLVKIMRGCKEDDFATVARMALGSLDVSAIKTLPEQQRNNALKRLAQSGLSAYRIERLTGIGRTLIARVINEA